LIRSPNLTLRDIDNWRVKEGVDGRDKPGHDGECESLFGKLREVTSECEAGSWSVQQA